MVNDIYAVIFPNMLTPLLTYLSLSVRLFCLIYSDLSGMFSCY